MSKEMQGTQGEAAVRESRRILLVSTGPPWPPDHGGRQRTALMCEALNELAETHLLICSPFGPLPSEQELSHMRDQFGVVECVLCRRPAGHGLWGPFRRFAPATMDRLAFQLGSHRWQYDPDPIAMDAIQQMSSQYHYDVAVARYLPSAARTDLFGQWPVAVDVDDMETDVLARRIESPRHSILARNLARWRLRRTEPRIAELLRASQHIWVTKPEDLPTTSVSSSVLPNIPYFPEGLPEVNSAEQADPILLMVGSMSLKANRRGVDWFLHHIWPRIRRNVPEARFRIVGRAMSESVKTRWRQVNGVEPVGGSDDLAAEYSNCAAVVVPVFEGGGTKIKVAEALAYRRAAVITPLAHRGYERKALNGEAVYVAHDTQAFVEYAVELLRNPDRASRMGAHGRRVIERYFSRERFVSRVKEDVRPLLKA